MASAWETAKAIAEASGHQIGRTPLEWANLLHLSRQVVARAVFLTDGSDRDIPFGKRTIHLEHASPEEIRLAQSIPGGAVLALPHADSPHPLEAIRILHRTLEPGDWAVFLQEAKAAGGWIAKAVAIFDRAHGGEGSPGVFEFTMETMDEVVGAAFRAAMEAHDACRDACARAVIQAIHDRQAGHGPA